MLIFYTFIADLILDQPRRTSFTLKPGQYRVSCYGAQGGSGYKNGHLNLEGGKGACISGIMVIKGAQRIFYANVGGKGSSNKSGVSSGGFNGGGSSGDDTSGTGNDGSGGGGGATDLRIDDNSLNSRIIVAAGGSGSAYDCEGAPGGTLNGYKAISNNKFAISDLVTQTAGNLNGKGSNGIWSLSIPGSGGGGGWRGGVSTNYAILASSSYKAVAHSGSSYISGYPGCILNYKMAFTSISMYNGYNKGDGKLEILFDWECSLPDHSCIKDTIVVKCFDGFFEHQNKCVSSCPSGFIAVNTKCEKCEEPCAACYNSISSCISCLTGYLYENKCVSECPIGTINTGKSCMRCESANGYCSSINSINESQQITLKSGRYRVKCYGAQGGPSLNYTTPFKQGGRGAYVTGIMTVNGKETKFFVNIGKMGGSSTNESSIGGNNGGGNGGKFLGTNIQGISSSGGGGGSTDLRIYDNSTSNRIIVASGGSGAVFGCDGAPGGALRGMIAFDNDNFSEIDPINCNPRHPIEVSRDGLDSEFIPQSGGGGGYFGGLASNQIGRYENESWKSVSESGNSYLSGYEGCENHKFMIFEDGLMISGYNEGNGRVEIETEFECPFNCYSCTSQNKCTKCFDNYFLFNDGKECVSKCPVDYAGTNGECVKCSSPCDTCSSTSTTCTSCIGNYNLYQNKCYSTCPTGTVPEGLIPAGFKCTECKSPCKTCTIFADRCLSCIDGYYLYQNTCLGICPAGTIEGIGECISCQSSCSKCSGSTTNCIECKSGYYLNGNECVSACPSGMTGSGKTCISCDSSDSSCTKSIESITKNEKFILKSGSYKVECYGGQGGGSYNFSASFSTGGRGAYTSGVMKINGAGTTFYSSIGKSGTSSTNQQNLGGAGGGGYGGLYIGSSETGISSSGGGGGASDLRINSNSLSNRIIVAAGGSGAAYACDGAPGGKLKGFIPTSNNYFTESTLVNQSNGYSLGQGQSGSSSNRIPISGGGSGYRGGYKASTVGTSLSESWKSVSHSGCSYISGYVGCTPHSRMVFTDPSMQSGYNSGDGYISIKPQYECSYKCHTCTSETICIRCLDNYLMYKNQCVLSCPIDSIKVNDKCQVCTSPCLTCENTTYTCTSCIAGYYLLGNICYQNCPPNYANVNRACERCLQPCSTCSGSLTNCTSCVEGYFLYENECVDSCPQGFYGINNMCEKCISPCKTCTSESNCLTCQENYYFYENECIQSCPDGYIEVNMKCEKCASPCQTCIFNQDTCTSCEPDFYLYKTECLPSCPSHTIAINMACELCIFPCNVCQTSQKECTVCMEGYYLYEGKCIDLCPNGYTNVDGICEQCIEICAECQNSVTECTKCKLGFYLYEGECVQTCPKYTFIYEDQCIETCPNGTFISEDKCEICSDKCGTCSNSKDHCDTCLNNMFLYDHNCYIECNEIENVDEGYFGKDEENHECRKCSDQNCIECSNNYSICTECREFYYLENNKCNLKPTSAFTNSQIFTKSSPFSLSQKFTSSSKFSKSSIFSSSSKFSHSSLFTKSHSFKQTSLFSHSCLFTASSEFTQSSIFSETSKFAKTLPFSMSMNFSQSSSFSHSFLFTASSEFTQSFIFTEASKFTKTLPFSFSMPFTMSHSFVQASFSHSCLFTTSSEFTQSLHFSFTHKFTESSEFTSSFTNSLQFDQTFQLSQSLIIPLSSESIALESLIFSEISKESLFISEISDNKETYDCSGSVLKPTNKIEIKEPTPKRKNTTMIIGISIAAFVIIIALALIAIIIIIKKKKQGDPVEKNDESQQESAISFNNNVSPNNQYQDETDRDLDFWL